MKTKKLLSIAAAVLMVCSLSTTAFAANDADGTVPVDGYIGFDQATTDPSTVISISYSTGGVEWAVTDASNPAGTVLAGNYTLTNNSTANVDLTVTLKSFTLTSAANTLPASGLTLNLTGDLGANGIGQNIGAGAYTNTTAYTAKLTHTAVWTYSFGGSYTGPIPTTPLQPTYSMVLNFAL